MIESQVEKMKFACALHIVLVNMCGLFFGEYAVYLRVCSCSHTNAYTSLLVVLINQARYGATLAARRRDDPSSAEAQPAIRAHHGLFA